jgi:hypothetical protein
MLKFFQKQIQLYKTFLEFSEKASWNYPPYCNNNDYFEDFFYKRYLNELVFNKQKFNRFYIPILWTSFLKNNEWVFDDKSKFKKLQKLINNLDPVYSYFTVCTHDNAPILELPKFTYNFSAGSYGQKDSPMFQNLNPLFKNRIENMEDFRINIPIPLVTNKNIKNFVKKKNYEKKYLASFIGSNSHKIRFDIEKQYKNNINFFIKNKNNPNMENNMEDVNFFIEKSLESYFILCPRGWGATSYRLYEAMQLKRVPVYISDIFWLPWENEINWNDMCVFIPPEKINDLENILNNEIQSGQYQKKLEYIDKIYNEYFTFESIFNKIKNLVL